MSTEREVFFIDHTRAVHAALVVNTNNDGSKDLVIVTSDEKLRRKSMSADWHMAIELRRHIKPYLAKFKAALDAENETALQGGRDADFSDKALEAFTLDTVAESFVEQRSSLVFDKSDSNLDGKLVTDVILLGSQSHTLPDPYRIPRKEPEALPAVPVAAGTEQGDGGQTSA